ncbi:DUF2188 domain-containing protein [Nocardioides sp. AN3]
MAVPRGDVETYHSGGKWFNRIEGGEDLPGSYDSKDEAVCAGHKIARERGVEHIIRSLDGRIGERDSFGHDPRSIRG